MTLGVHPLISYQEAREQALTIMRQAKAGEDPAARLKAGLAVRNFRELSDKFLNEYAAVNCNERTVSEYRRIISKELLPVFGGTSPSSLSADQVTALIKKIEINRRSPTMAARTRALINNIYEYAVERGLVAANPVPSLQIKIESEKKQRVLSEKEIAALWRALEGEEIRTAAAFKLLLLTGQRAGDVLSMRWKDINFTTWKLAGQGKGAEVYLSPPAVQVLETLHELTGNQEFVFSSKQGNEHLQYIGKAAERISKRMASHEPWRPVDLRTTVEIHLRNLSMHPRVIDQVLNRTSRSRKISAQKAVTSNDIKGALTRWGQKVLELTSPARRQHGGDKIVKLFE